MTGGDDGWQPSEAPVELRGGWSGAWFRRDGGLFRLRGGIVFGDRMLHVDVVFLHEYLVSRYAPEWVRSVLDCRAANDVLTAHRIPLGLISEVVGD